MTLSLRQALWWLLIAVCFLGIIGVISYLVHTYQREQITIITITENDLATYEQGSCPNGTFDPYTVDTLTLGPTDVPYDLVELPRSMNTKYDNLCLERRALAHLDQMIVAMQAEGLEPIITSTFRSYRIQAILYENSVARYGAQEPRRVAPPGTSEHQLGTTVDFSAERIDGASAARAFENTPEKVWLDENAADYGFILSYPENAPLETGYIYEPWHWRFIGTE